MVAPPYGSVGWWVPCLAVLLLLLPSRPVHAQPPAVMLVCVSSVHRRACMARSAELTSVFADLWRVPAPPPISLFCPTLPYPTCAVAAPSFCIQTWTQSTVARTNDTPAQHGGERRWKHAMEDGGVAASADASAPTAAVAAGQRGRSCGTEESCCSEALPAHVLFGPRHSPAHTGQRTYTQTNMLLEM